jgi:GNAT superfamily N-acetyltransferase
VEVRAATGDDADAIAGIQERGWQVAYAHLFPADELQRGGFIHVERWRDRLEQPPYGWSTFVAEREDRVLGFVTVGPSRDALELGELYAIYVEPAAWSTGAGRALIERAEAQLAETWSGATLWVLEDNPRARSFYEEAGWRADGARKADERWGVRAAEVRYRKELR